MNIKGLQPTAKGVNKMKYQEYTKWQLERLEKAVNEFNNNSETDFTRLQDLGLIFGLQADKENIYDYDFETNKFIKV